MKKLIYYILSLFCLGQSISVQAQKMYSWELFPSYHNSTQNVPAGNKIYTLCNGNLMSYNTSDTEVYLYDRSKELNSSNITFIEYNNQLKKLIVVYNDGNIDLIKDNGDIVNMPQYHNKNINNKNINGVNIVDQYALLSTGFGILMIDMDKEIIVNTYSLNMSVNSATIFKDKIYASTQYGIYTGDLSLNLLDKKNWKEHSGHIFSELANYDQHLFGNKENENLYCLSDDESDFNLVEAGAFKYLNVCNGVMIAGNTAKTCIFKNASNYISVYQSNAFTDLTYSNGVYWGSKGYSGLQPYKLNETNNFIPVQEGIIPNSPVRDYFNFLNFQNGDLLAVGGNLNYNGIVYPGTVMIQREDGKWENFADGNTIVGATSLPYINTINMAQDPRDPNHHFVTSARYGLYEFQNGKLVKHYMHKNSRLNAVNNTYVRTSGAIYDKDNNLWLINNHVDTLLNIIKADGQWVKIYNENIKQTITCDHIMFDHKGRIWLNCRYEGTAGLIMLDYNGTIEDTSDDISVFQKSLVNQDGIKYTSYGFYCMAEDKNGEIWVGTDVGLFVVSDPDNFTSDDFYYTQIKVPRNDGTNFADYLLANTTVNCIAVDGANQKWIGTTGGVYLVSPDGMETIHHFTVDNSPLLSNNINSIAINPDNGAVMIATDRGLAAFYNDVSEPETVLSDDQVIAYPNPVKPEYNGYITIKGLTENSNVKITGPNGQLVVSGTSKGGFYTWNGRNKQGKRAASGVYSVIATDQEGKESVVTKIVMIK